LSAIPGRQSQSVGCSTGPTSGVGLAVGGLVDGGLVVGEDGVVVGNAGLLAGAAPSGDVQP
jgi:hypothetical protein